MIPSRLRRVVTGPDADGRSVILSDGPSPTILDDDPAAWVAEAWVTDGPADTADVRDLAAGPFALAPAAGGSRFRIYEIPPAGHAASSTGMHMTPTLDYVVVISGHVWLVVDNGEVELGPGECVVQRGTAHAFENRRDVPCVAAAVLLGASTS